MAKKKIEEVKEEIKEETKATNTGEAMSEQDIEQQAKDILDKVNAPIYLNSPLKYNKGDIVIEKLSQAERDQILFKFITKMSATLDYIMLTANDMLLLQMEQCKRNGIRVKDIIDKSTIVDIKNKKNK